MGTTTFNYKARDKEGKEITGRIEALREDIVVKSLRRMGYSIISMEKESSAALRLEAFFSRFKKIKTQEILMFVRQLSTLIVAGTPIVTSIMSIREQTKNKLMIETLNQIIADLKEGINLSDSFAKHPRVFSPYFVSMVRVGETGGILEKVLERVVQLFTQEIEIRSRIKSAVSYPIILIIVAVSIVTFILATIVPKFVTIFETYGAQLPLATRILLAVSLLVKNFWYVPLIILIGGLVWLNHFLKSEEKKYKFDKFLFKLPLLGPLYLRITIAQFARTLAALIKSGVPLLDGLKVTQGTLSSVAMRKIIEDLSKRLSKGESLSEPFKETGIFPPMVIQMISVGEKSGRFEQVLFDVANFYDQEIDYTIRNTMTILEPMLLLVMGSMVAFIALSVLLPIFNLVKVFRH